MLEQIVARFPFFILVAARCFAIFLTVPLLASRAVPQAARVALAGYAAFLVLP